MCKFRLPEIKLTGDAKIKILSITCAFLGGIILGFMMAPIKKGIYCGNNNGNSNKFDLKKRTTGIKKNG